MSANRFSEIKHKMTENLRSKETAEPAEVESKLLSEEISNNVSTQIINNDLPVASSRRIQEVPKSQSIVETPMTRKTTSMPLVLDLAVKELKDRRNLARQTSRKEKGRTTEDDIMIEALEFFFNQKGEFKDCLMAAQNKLKYLA